jgi:hypothetical protein
MIYPKTEEQRDRFEAAAKNRNKGLSPFIVEIVEQYLNDEQRRQELRDERLRKEIEEQDKLEWSPLFKTANR